MDLTRQETIAALKQGTHKITNRRGFTELNCITLDPSRITVSSFDEKRTDGVNNDEEDVIFVYDFELVPPPGFNLPIGGFNSFCFSDVIDMTKID